VLRVLLVGLLLVPFLCVHPGDSAAVPTVAVDLAAPACPDHDPDCAAEAVAAAAVPAPRAAVPEPLAGAALTIPGSDPGDGLPAPGRGPAPAEVRSGALILVAIGVSRR
jgi:hypothetical protein